MRGTGPKEAEVRNDGDEVAMGRWAQLSDNELSEA